ncbi:MAG: LysR family transcriptional regulator [Propionicimonas sp.]
MLDLNRLRILRSVAATGSVNDAARLLGYTPSTVSQHLHTLEREVGFPVIERVGRGIRVTPAGLQLAEAGAEPLEAMAQLEARTRDLRQGATGKLTLRAFASAAYTWIPRVARSLRQEFSGLTLELSIIESESADPMARADVEVRTELPFQEPHVPHGYTRVVLGTDDYLVALPPEHPLAGSGATDLVQFAADDWVHYDFRDDIGTRIVGQACAGAGFSPRYVARAADHVSGLAFVAAGVGIAVVPQLVVGWSAFDVAYVQPRNPTPARRIVALIRDSARANPAAARTLVLLGGLGQGLSELGAVSPRRSSADQR